MKIGLKKYKWASQNMFNFVNQLISRHFVQKRNYSAVHKKISKLQLYFKSIMPKLFSKYMVRIFGKIQGIQVVYSWYLN